MKNSQMMRPMMTDYLPQSQEPQGQRRTDPPRRNIPQTNSSQHYEQNVCA